MRQVRCVVHATLVVLMLIASASCTSNAPPNLSPEGKLDWSRLQIIKALDLLRNTAIDGHETTPPLFSEKTTGAVVTYHRSAITIVHSTSLGWQATLATGLDELVKNLPPAEAQRLGPYIVLIRTVLVEVTK